MAARRKTARTTRARARKPARKTARTSARTAARKPARPAGRGAEKRYGKRKDYGRPIDAFLKKLPDPQRTIIERIRGIVRGALPGVEEAIKWGMPVWSKNGMLCYTKPAKTYVRFGFYARVMDDSAGLPLEGSGSMAHVKLTSPSQIVEEAFTNWTRKAAALAR